MPYFVILAILIAVGAVTFALQNATLVTVHLFTMEFQSSLALVLLITFVLGILLGFLVLMPRLIKNRVKVTQHRKQIKDLEKRLDTAVADSQSGPGEEDRGEGGDAQALTTLK